MEIIPYQEKSGASNPRQDENRTGELVAPEEIINCSPSSSVDDGVLNSEYDDPRDFEEMHRYTLAVWLENMEYDVVPEMPPAFVVQYSG